MSYIINNSAEGYSYKSINKIKKLSLQYNWYNAEFIKNYSDRIDKGLEECETILTSDFHDKKIIATRALTVICKTLCKSAEKAFHEINNKKKDKKRAKIRRKKKSWWDNSLEWLHVKLCKAYQEYRVSGWGNTERREYLESRKQFRAKKRHNIKLKRSLTYKFIEDLFSLNKESFWKRIARMGRSSQRIDMEIDKLKLEYEKVFTVSNRSVDDEIADKLKVEEYLSYHSNSIFRRKTDQSLIKTMTGNLSLRKAIGLRGISHEMLKFNCSKKLAAVIASLFDLITNHQIMPDVFNLSVIKPLVKDPKKPSDDIGNIRPVAVSDALSNLFERLILQRINNEHTDHKKQFGFKTNSSCNHAAFVLKVAASLTKCRGQRLYACAIDASKAFDKVSRSKLWLKLIEKNLSPDTTIAIIKYYEQSIMLVQITDEFSTPFLAKLGYDKVE